MPSVYKEPRKTIAVNLDETLSHTLAALLSWHNDQYGTQHLMSDVDSMDLTQLWGGTHEDVCLKIRAFYASQAFEAIQPIHDFALEALKMLKKRRFHLVIITSRQQFIAEETKRFVDRHYPGIFESIYFCNLGLSETEQMEYISKSKSTICQEIGVDVLIDHQLEHVLECAVLGIDVLLYDSHGQYGWNQHTSSSFKKTQLSHYSMNTMNIQRVTSWRDIIHLHFPKPNSPLRHLIYSSSSEQQQQHNMDVMDEDQDNDTESEYELCHQCFDRDGNQILLSENEEQADE
ncbi:hypothetical protein BC941DRAFT_384040 [Chlamydoabsidia padenii]|nr:hypothetical protein BC941DRAFT_384040 [Chlamydoabsidia padenii]